MFINAAIQNRDFSLDDKPYKMTGILAARVLNHLMGNSYNIHAWNTVGAFNDMAESTPEDRLTQKYDSQFMQDHLSRWSDLGLDVLRDDDPEFSSWAVKIMERALLVNDCVEIKEESFVNCGSCDTTIAEASVDVSSCTICCKKDSLQIVSESALFVKMPDDSESLLPFHRRFNKVNLRHEVKTLENIPHRLLLSRDRLAGIDLEQLGLPGKKLDPRLGIGLLALYAANKHRASSVSLTQSASTLVRTVPYLSGVIHDSDALQVPNFSYTFHGRISPELFCDKEVPPELWGLQSLGQRNDVRVETAYPLKRQRKSILAKYGQLSAYSSNSKPSVDLNEGNLSQVLASTNKNLGRAVDKSRQIGTDDTHETVSSISQVVNGSARIVDIIR